MAASNKRKKGVKYNKNYTPITDPLKRKIRSIIQSSLVRRKDLTNKQKAVRAQLDLEHELGVLKRQRIRGY